MPGLPSNLARPASSRSSGRARESGSGRGGRRLRSRDRSRRAVRAPLDLPVAPGIMNRGPPVRSTEGGVSCCRELGREAGRESGTLADRTRKWGLNVVGPFYVDESCLDCDLCRVTAPHSFRAHEEGCHSYVFHQPVSAAEIALCLEALQECPVEAIGRDEASCDGTPRDEGSGPGDRSRLDARRPA